MAASECDLMTRLRLGCAAVVIARGLASALQCLYLYFD